MKIRWLGFLNKKRITQSREEQPVEAVKILEARQIEDKVCLKVAISKEFYDDLYEFLKQKGLTCWGNDKKAIALLLKYGLSEDSRVELERNKNEIERVMSRYCSMRFQVHEYHMQNFEIAKGLRFHLQKNKSLKHELKERGLETCVSEDEWDKWDDNFIDEFYGRYVFCK